MEKYQAVCLNPTQISITFFNGHRFLSFSFIRYLRLIQLFGWLGIFGYLLMMIEWITIRSSGRHWQIEVRSILCVIK